MIFLVSGGLISHLSGLQLRIFHGFVQSPDERRRLNLYSDGRFDVWVRYITGQFEIVESKIKN